MLLILSCTGKQHLFTCGVHLQGQCRAHIDWPPTINVQADSEIMLSQSGDKERDNIAYLSRIMGCYSRTPYPDSERVGKGTTHNKGSSCSSEMAFVDLL